MELSFDLFSFVLILTLTGIFIKYSYSKWNYRIAIAKTSDLCKSTLSLRRSSNRVRERKFTFTRRKIPGRGDQNEEASMSFLI